LAKYSFKENIPQSWEKILSCLLGRTFLIICETVLYSVHQEVKFVLKKIKNKFREIFSQGKLFVKVRDRIIYNFSYGIASSIIENNSTKTKKKTIYPFSSVCGIYSAKLS
jgi:hypothetical protein